MSMDYIINDVLDRLEDIEDYLADAGVEEDDDTEVEDEE